ncbi:MAG: sugar ABC transporter permease [Oscillospiraceae bacterium]|nr:sugar ABC transporter permease [Oscillospiraceae bacterium]
MRSSAVRIRNRARPYLWLLPAFILFFVFTFYPFLQTIYKSLFIVDTAGRAKTFVGLDNYRYILSDGRFLTALKNTLWFVVLTVPISKVLGFALAMLANKRRALSSFYETSFAMPMAMAASVIGMIFQLLYVSPLGIINGTLGINIRWLTDARYAMLAIAIIQIWLSTGYAFVFLLSAIRSVPSDLVESTAIDGAGPLRQVFSIYLPLVSPTMFYLIFTDMAYGMMMMSLVNILTNGGPSNSTLTLMQYIFRQFNATGNYTNANPAAVVTFLLTFAVTMATFAWEDKGVHYQ